MLAKYLVLEKSYINDAIRQPGDIVELDCNPGPNLRLIDDAEAAERAAKTTDRREQS